MDAFAVNLKKYADLILKRGIHLRKDEYVLIVAEMEHRRLVLALAESAYRMGASYVNVIYTDERVARSRLDYSSADNLSIVPEGKIAELKNLIKIKGCYIMLTGSENPSILNGIDAKRSSAVISAKREKLDFFSIAAAENRLKWCIAGAATEGLAGEIFPDLRGGNVKERLWEEIFRICRINEKDVNKAWDKHVERLNRVTDRLNTAKVKKLHYSGPGIDLTIGLHKDAVWKGGGSETEWGEYFMLNIPTEEIYTAPDYRTVNGVVQSTRPLFFEDSVLIRDIRMEFKDGKLVELGGSEGIESLREVLKLDAGAKRLGEVALAEKTSPVFTSGLIFYDTLYDENAASHIALGTAYPECIRNGKSLSDTEKDRVGLNRSKVHIDIMIGSSEVSIDAELYNGGTESIMKDGLFNF